MNNTKPEPSSYHLSKNDISKAEAKRKKFMLIGLYLWMISTALIFLYPLLVGSGMGSSFSNLIILTPLSSLIVVIYILNIQKLSRENPDFTRYKADLYRYTNRYKKSGLDGSGQDD